MLQSLTDDKIVTQEREDSRLPQLRALVVRAGFEGPNTVGHKLLKEGRGHNATPHKAENDVTRWLRDLGATQDTEKLISVLRRAEALEARVGDLLVGYCVLCSRDSHMILVML